MKFNLVAQTVLVFVNFIYPGFYGAQAQKTSSLPLITVELLNKNDKVFKYPTPSPGRWHDRLSVDFPLSFRNESIILWESKDYTAGSKSGTEIKLRLKCEAPYLTKWTITTHSKAKAEDTKPFYHMNYNVKKLPRDREIPLWFPQPNGKSGEFIYNLTELTVNGFGPEFKGGFINCVHRSDESLKSELYIFQRFGANDKFNSVDQISRNVTNLKYIPCIVYDPDVKIQYQQFVQSFSDFKLLEAKYTTYNWRLGYSKTSGKDYIAGVSRARCALLNDKNYYVEYNITAKTTTLNRAITLTQNSNQDGNHTPSDFVCTFENGRQARATSLRLEQCASPDFCFSGPRPNTYIGSHDSRNNDNGEGDAQIQGKISCSPKIEDFYFTGFSGKIYLLSQSPPPPQEDLFRMSIYEGTKAIRVSCSAVKFLTFEPIEFSVLRYDSDSNKLLKDAFRKDIFPQVLTNVSDRSVKWAESVYTKTVVLGFDHVDGVRGFSCHVPWFNSTEWISVHKNLEFKYEYGDRVLPKAEGELTTSTSKPTPGVTNPRLTSPFVETTTKQDSVDKESSFTSNNGGASIPQNNQTLIIAMSSAFAFVLIGVILIIVAISVTIYRRKIRSLQEKLRELTNEEIQEFFEGNVGSGQADAGYGFIQSQPFNKEYEIERDQIDIFPDKVLGSGAYGLVLHGKMKDGTASGSGTSTSDGGTVVAVKTVKPNVDTTFFMALLTELKVMCFVGKHANVASLIGAVTTNIKNREVYVALEFCAKGDLLGYIKKHRADFQDLIAKIANANRMYSNLPANTTATTSFSVGQPSTGSSPGQSDSFSTMDLLEWSQQMSSGMEFICSKKVIHGDLAARNVLLTAGNVAKISDFGLSRQLHNYSTYMKKSKTPLPWRWMAVESLRDMNFSVQSDVWSFGVTLYEIFELGALPYPGCNWTNEFVNELVDGYRLKSPKFGNQEIYNLMMDCMKLEPTERTTFSDIFYKLQDIKSALASQLPSESGGVYVVCQP